MNKLTLSGKIADNAGTLFETMLFGIAILGMAAAIGFPWIASLASSTPSLFF